MASNSQFAVAVHILSMLALKSGEKVKSVQIAESVNTNAVVIRRLLCDLQNANLVVSHKGATGGTQLARSPRDISLYDIYEAVATGDVFSLHPATPNQDCIVGKNIESVLCNIQKDIDCAIKNKLGRYSLSNVQDFVENGEVILA